jgi:LAO/AO transport system kinase
LVDIGKRVAVLAVDPSSTITGGSILGDKTRMQKLSINPSAFIRPSPSSGTLGGVARSTMETIILCEAAGYDVIIVETVGVGQSETLVNEMVDFFCLLVQPGGGDELQGLKKGVVELCDLIVVTKADGDLEKASNITQSEYLSALKLLSYKNPNWKPKVLKVSSFKGIGFDVVWNDVCEYYQIMRGPKLHQLRGKQRKTWLWRTVTDEIIANILREKGDKVRDIEQSVIKGIISPMQGADDIIRHIPLINR